MIHADYCKQFIPEGGIVLDVGSGRGKFLSVMASLGFKAYGVEINSAYITESENRAKSEGVLIKVVQGRGEKLPFLDNQLDFINCSEVTEHVENPFQVCREIFRVLKNNRKCYISFHNRFGIYDYHYHLFGINCIPRCWTEKILKILGKQKSDNGVGHQKLVTMHYFTYRAIAKDLKNIGFIVKDIREEKIKRRYGGVRSFILCFYWLLRPFYFNTFHLLLEKR
ncbi:class I SAM-dependent methyltransferase [Candidatus Peregrinibacteria bacterium]|nr:class I SAM-dependent methyltransferase [Candidatus Peregrinibacteria bacterium]